MMFRSFSFRGLPLLFGACALTFVLTGACGDDDAGAEPSTSGATGTASGANTPPSSGATVDTAASPTLLAPASQYSILVQDLGIANFITDPKGTFLLDSANYGATGAFDGAEAGKTMLEKWGYIEGFESAMTPEGGASSVLNGGYAINQEIHLFRTADGAETAYKYFVDRISSNGITSTVTVQTVGNEAAAFRLVTGKVGGSSNVAQVLHQIVFRRGNMVAIMLTIGAEPLMTTDTVRELSLMVDGKALGARDHPVPTPVPARPTQAPATARP
ncbi:MAG: hypothetical protein AB7T37_06300 [Dehalococcoidia bacterium]